MGVTVRMDCPRAGCAAWVMVSFEEDEPPEVYGEGARPDECAVGHALTPLERATLVRFARQAESAFWAGGADDGAPDPGAAP